nr:hypothetical protein [Moorena producens]
MGETPKTALHRFLIPHTPHPTPHTPHPTPHTPHPTPHTPQLTSLLKTYPDEERGWG